jgi:uncharacterized protein DUF6335
MARSRAKAAKGTKASKGATRAKAAKRATTRSRKAAARPRAKAAAKGPRAVAGRSRKAKTARKASKAPARAVKAKTIQRAAPAAKRAARTSGKAVTRASKARAASRPGRAPTLDRERRRATEPDLVPTPPSSLDLDRSASAARSGRAELAHKLHEHTQTGPALTAGDVDADWESADSVGDEAPGGDNPTPDQDVVDEIGRSLGVEYDDDEELQGGAEIGERDRKRWELDPASSDDFDDRDE